MTNLGLLREQFLIILIMWFSAWQMQWANGNNLLINPKAHIIQIDRIANYYFFAKKSYTVTSLVVKFQTRPEHCRPAGTRARWCWVGEREEWDWGRGGYTDWQVGEEDRPMRGGVTPASPASDRAAPIAAASCVIA